MGTDAKTNSELSPNAKALEAARKSPEMTKRHIGAFLKKNEDIKLWALASFESRRKYDSRGIPDMIAVRRNHKSEVGQEARYPGDLLEIILIDVKGSLDGEPQYPSKKKDIPRLIKVSEDHRAKKIILARCWVHKDEVAFYELDQSWNETYSKDPWSLKEDLRDIFE